MSKRIVSYDFSVDSIIVVDAPYGTDPDTLVGQALIKLIQKVRQDDLTLICENTFDAETGSYEDIPQEWYKGHSEQGEDELPETD